MVLGTLLLVLALHVLTVSTYCRLLLSVTALKKNYSQQCKENVPIDDFDYQRRFSDPPQASPSVMKLYIMHPRHNTGI